MLETTYSNLGNLLRQLALPREVKHWSLTTLREKRIKIGAKVVMHAKTVPFQMAEVAVPRPLFAAILDRIGRLRAALGADWIGVEARGMVRLKVSVPHRGDGSMGSGGPVQFAVAPSQFARQFGGDECRAPAPSDSAAP
jgi:hypothetical protein